MHVVACEGPEALTLKVQKKSGIKSYKEPFLLVSLNALGSEEKKRTSIRSEAGPLWYCFSAFKALSKKKIARLHAQHEFLQRFLCTLGPSDGRPWAQIQFFQIWKMLLHNRLILSNCCIPQPSHIHTSLMLVRLPLSIIPVWYCQTLCQAFSIH